MLVLDTSGQAVGVAGARVATWSATPTMTSGALAGRDSGAEDPAPPADAESPPEGGGSSAGAKGPGKLGGVQQLPPAEMPGKVGSGSGVLVRVGVLVTVAVSWVRVIVEVPGGVRLGVRDGSSAIPPLGTVTVGVTVDVVVWVTVRVVVLLGVNVGL